MHIDRYSAPEIHSTKEITISRAATEYRDEKRTWPQINDAVDLGKIRILPWGAVERHGDHLPLDIDLVCPGGIAHGTGREIADQILVLPQISYEGGFVFEDAEHSG